MAEPDAAIPSEDEEFDTVTDTTDDSEHAVTTPKTVVVKDDTSEEKPASEHEETSPEPEHVTPEETLPNSAEENTISEDASEEVARAPEFHASHKSSHETAVEVEPDNRPEPTAEAAAAPQHHVGHEPPLIPAVTATGHHKKKPSIHFAIEILLVLALAGVGMWAWTLHSDRKDLQDQLAKVTANPQALLQKQSDELVQKVGLLVPLPKDETPTVANVTDAAQAKSQSAFFNAAENGDKVLVYVKAGYAVLYRPSTNKVVYVGPLTTTAASTAKTTSATTKAVTSTPATGSTTAR